MNNEVDERRLTEEEARTAARAIHEEIAGKGLPIDNPKERRAIALKLAVETMPVRGQDEGAIFETSSRVLWLAHEYTEFIESGLPDE